MKNKNYSTGLARFFAQIAFTTVLIAGVICAPASALAKDDLSVELEAKKVVKAEGTEKLESAAKAKPGDVIEYHTICKNTGSGGISNLRPTLPIPKGMELLEDSAKPTASEGSLDGVKFEKMPIQRKMKNKEGKMELQDVPASQYRALRWYVGDLAGGASTTLVARVRVSASSPVPVK